MKRSNKEYLTGAVLGLIISALIYWAIYAATV